MQSSEYLLFQDAIAIAGNNCACTTGPSIIIGGQVGSTGPTGPTGSSGSGDWSLFPAIQNIDLFCNNIINCQSLSFCDGTYIGPGSSLDISSSQKIVITSSSGSNTVSLVIDGSNNNIQNYTTETLNSSGVLNQNATVSYVTATPQILPITNCITNFIKIIINTSASTVNISSLFLQNGTTTSSYNLSPYNSIRFIWNGTEWNIL